jgi:hypothetical protein
MGEIMLTDELLDLLGDIYINHTEKDFKQKVTFGEFVDAYLEGKTNVKF